MKEILDDDSNFRRDFIIDHSLILLIASNLILIFFALYENWNLITIMFIYWCQSIIIGFFTFLKILSLNDFSTEGISFPLISSTNKMQVKITLAFFFLFHYSFFHIGYFIFLISGSFISTGEKLELSTFTIILVLFIFIINHTFSFLYNRKKDAKKKYNIRNIFMFPYIRIIPMHLTIIFGSILIASGFPRISLIFFLLTKTVADVAMHIVEHRELLKEKLIIYIDKTEYHPNDEINGKINLAFNRAKKAKFLKINFIVEKIIIMPSSDSKQNYQIPIYTSEKILDGEKEYLDEYYNFNFKIPNDILYRIQNCEKPKNLLKTKNLLETFGMAQYIREYNKIYIKAEMDIPLGLNIKNELEFKII